jgi:hypothetical protein
MGGGGILDLLGWAEPDMSVPSTVESSLYTVEGAMERDEVSPRISNSELEVEEAKEIGGDDRGIDEASLKISTSGLGIEEAKGMDEASPKIGTSTETNFEGMGNERFFDLYCCVLQSNLYRLFSSPSTTEISK